MTNAQPGVIRQQRDIRTATPARTLRVSPDRRVKQVQIKRYIVNSKLFNQDVGKCPIRPSTANSQPATHTTGLRCASQASYCWS